MQERLEYAIAIMYQLGGSHRQQIFVINSESINEGLVLSGLEDCRANRYIVAGRIAKSEIQFTIPNARDIEWIGTMLPISPSILKPMRN